MRSPRIEMTYPTGNDEVAVDAGGTVTLRCSGIKTCVKVFLFYLSRGRGDNRSENETLRQSCGHSGIHLVTLFLNRYPKLNKSCMKSNKSKVFSSFRESQTNANLEKTWWPTIENRHKRRNNQERYKLDKLILVIESFHNQRINLVYSVNGTTLILRAVRQIDSGDVICIAANGYLPIVSHKFILVVQCKIVL